MTEPETRAAPLSITLEARCPARNVARRYEVCVSPDLFGWVILDQHWGRIGARGQHRRRACTSNTEAAALVAAILRKRAGARRRIGVDYRPVAR